MSVRMGSGGRTYSWTSYGRHRGGRLKPKGKANAKGAVRRRRRALKKAARKAAGK